MKEKDLIFQTLKQIADAMTQTFGENCEVAVHDLSSLDHSLIHITGNVTQRELGSPVTDAVLKTLMEKGNEVRDRIGFQTITEDGRELKSSTSYIRDSRGEVVYAFCVNFDTTDFLNAVQALEMFACGQAGRKNESPKISEKMAFSIDHTLDNIFEEAVGEIGKRPATMSTDEKIRLVRILERKGAFQIKGAVSKVSLRLGVSNFTIYNYLKKIRAADEVGITGTIG